MPTPTVDQLLTRLGEISTARAALRRSEDAVLAALAANDHTTPSAGAGRVGDLPVWLAAAHRHRVDLDALGTRHVRHAHTPRRPVEVIAA